ncbi:hypothetical protein Trydic_g6384 [Trypoxylus dichotomus]
MGVLNADCVLYIILLFLWLEYLWEIYLSVRQYKVTKKTVQVPSELSPVMTKDTFDKARLYSMDKNKYGMVNDTFSIFVSTVVIYCGILARIWKYSESINPWEGEVTVSCIWMFLLMTITTFINLPLSIYYTFVLEEKYGFNKQTAKFFVIDKIKAFAVNQVIVLPISAVTIVIVKYGGDLFFVWLWIVVGIIMLSLLTIYPSYIAPLFDKYTPLPEGELRTQIEDLASELKFPLAQLYVVEGSKRSAHSNAYFYGLFKSKRIVLFDTLLKNPESGGCRNDEILAVLSHELGHWSHGHIIKNLVIMQLNLFFVFAAFSFLFKFSPLYQAVGFAPGIEPVLVGLLVVMQYVMMPYNALLSFILTCLSRRFEFQADEFATKLGRAEPLKRALVQLNKDNLGFPIYDYLYSMWHHSHPPLLERITALKSKDQ